MRILFPLLLSAAITTTLNANIYFVSPSGSDTANNGLSIAAPFATIQRAANQMVAGDTCNIRAGTYPVTVTVPNSGSAGHPITFQAYNPTPGNPATAEVVTITGADPITSWTLESPNIYRAVNMPSGWVSLGDGNQVFQAGTMQPEARWPNAGSTFPWQDSTINPSPDWAYADTAGYDATGKNGWLTDTQLPARADGYWTGAKVHIMLGDGWYMFNPSVTGYTDATKTLATDESHGPVSGGSAGAYAMKAGNEYYITGKRGEMDSAGEWFHDTATNRLCYWSATPPSDVQVKTRNYGFNLSGRSFVNLVNLRFFACTLDPTKPYPTDCVFDGLNMKYASHSNLRDGAVGLKLGSRCVLRNSELAYASGGLVGMYGSDMLVINNHIHDGSYVPAGVGAITASSYGADQYAANRNLISHNTIHSVGHACIGYPGRFAIVEYNDIYDGMKMSTDGALCYWAADGGNSIIRYNLIHDAQGPVGHSGAGVMGLYLDNENSGWIVHHNIIWNISGRSMHNNARNNFDMVFNNTCWNCGGGAIQSHFWGDGETGCRFYNNLFNGVPGGNQDTWSHTDVRYNRTTDPLFVAPASGNFQLQASSPARDAGTVIPGVTDGFSGSAPDIGALESGASDWTASVGCKATPPSPDPAYVMPVMSFANQIKDGSFETGSLSPNWTTASGSNVGLLCSNAWHDPQLRSSYFGLQFGGGTSEVSQVVTGLLPDRRYKFYCGVQKTDAAAVVTVGVRSYGYPDVEFTVPTTGIWQQNAADPVGTMFAVPFVTGQASTSATVYVRVTRAANSSVAPKNANGTFPTTAASLVNLSGYSNTASVTPMYPATGVYVDDLGVELAQENTDPLPYRMPVVSYQFNESSGTAAHDATTHGTDATLASGAAFASGRQGNALTFTGLSQNARIPSVVVPKAGGSFTVAFWLKFNSVGAGEYPKPVNNAGWLAKGWHITSDPNMGVGMYLFSKDNSQNTDNPATGMASYLSQPLTAGVWTHVAFAFDRANGVLKSYRNGQASTTTAMPSGFGDINISTGVQIGGGFSNGQMDDFQLWDYALNDKEVAAVFAPDPTLALRYKFDEDAGAAKAWDAGGGGQHATLAGVDFTPSRQGAGNALTASGTSGSATTPASPQVPPTGGAGSFSVACWLKLAGVGGNARIASTNSDTLPAKGWLMDSDGSLNLRMRLFDQNLTEVTSPLASGLASGVWTHVAYTIDRTNALVTRYRNGQVDGVTAIPAGFGAVDTSDALRLATGITNGKMDDFRLYQRVLTWQEVQDIPRQIEAPPYDTGVTDLAVVQTSSVNAQLSWSDNTSNETGFRIERKIGSGGTYVTIGTVGANTITFTDVGPFTQGVSYFYRVIATGVDGDSGASNESSFSALAGSIAFLDTTQMKVSRTDGTALIPVRRSGGVMGMVTVNYATSNSSAVAGTHFTASSGTLTWADGETGTKNIAVPVFNDSTPHQSRQFRLMLSGAGGGATLGAYNTLAVLIEDPAATLPSPWSQLIFNGNGSVVDFSSASVAEGVVGAATLGGSGLSVAASQESGRFIYQTRTGDGVLTAYVPTPVPAQTGARFAVMVRASGNGTSKMAATVTSGDGGFGAKFAYRAGSPANSVLVGSATTQTTPRWIRITRVGDFFTSEASADGSAWTTLGSATVALPATAQWGLFHLSNGPSVTPQLSADYQLATFQNVSLGSVPVPAAPDGLSRTIVSPTSVTIQWNTKAYCQGYRIERRMEGGVFSQITDVLANNSQSTQSFADSIQADTAYEYRVVAYNSVGTTASATSVIVVSAPPEIHVTRTTADAGGADATIRMEAPDVAFGSQGVLTVSGPDPYSYDTSALAKTYLRFDLSGLPGNITQADLKLSFLTERGFDVATWAYMEPYLLTSDTGDVWDEATLTWNNAPFNDTAGTSLLPPSVSTGFYYVGNEADFPAVGGQATISLSASAINSYIGANHRITIVTIEEYESAQTDWASREYVGYQPPSLVLSFANPQPNRPGFLTTAPGTGGAINLAWIDSESNETGFQIERRVANGAWTALTTCAANATGYVDAAGLPGVAYDYRVRTVGAAGLSSWAMTHGLQIRPDAVINGPVRSADGATFGPTDDWPGNGYVPTGFTYCTATRNFVTGPNPSGTLMNNVSGWVGMKISMHGQPVTLRELGRWIVPGNSATHIVKLVNAATGEDVPGGSVTVDAAGAPAGFKYAPLAAAVTLSANTTYFLVSQETTGGDQWYQGLPAMGYASDVADSYYSVSSTDGTSYTTYYNFVPVSFTYAFTPDPVPFVVNHGMTQLCNNYNGWLGMKFTTGSAAMVVGELGRWVVPGNSGTHNLKLVNATTGVILGSTSLATAGATSGQFKYAALASPVVLQSSTSYYVLSQETAGGDQWYDSSLASTGSSTGYQSWLLANGLPMDASGNGGASATPANDNLPNLVKYALGLNPSACGHGGRLGHGQTTVGGENYLTFAYTCPEPAPAGISYAIEASTDLAAGNWSGSGITVVSNTVANGLRTVICRDNSPMAGAGKRFMRLKVAQP